MENIIQDFGKLYHPTSALVFYQTTDRMKDIYVEHFDMDKDGNPVNAHPLTIREAKFLSKALNIETKKNREFLKPQIFFQKIYCTSIRVKMALSSGTPKVRK